MTFPMEEMNPISVEARDPSAVPDGLGSRRGLSVRITTSVAALMLIAVSIAIAGLVWAARKADNSAMRYELSLLRNGLDAEQQRIAKEVEHYAVGDAIYHFAHSRYRANWVHTHIASRLAESYSHDLVMVLTPLRRPIYANKNGSVWVPSIYDELLAENIDYLVRETQFAFAEHVYRRPSNKLVFMPDFTGNIDAAYRSTFQLVGGVPALVTIMAIAPLSANVALLEGLPSTLVTVRYVDDAFLQRISTVNRLMDLHFVAGAERTGNSESALPLYDSKSKLLGHLVWTPSKHGSAMMDEAGPMMVLALSVILLLAVGVLRHAHTSTVRLAESEAFAKHQALHDDLSGLPNRVLFSRRLEEALLQARRTETCLGVVYVDLDHFKEVNDTLGHYAGDELIKAVARRLQSCISPADTVSRISGDEFALLAVSRHDVAGVTDVCRKLEAAFSEPFTIADQTLHTSCSMGVVISSGEGHTPVELLRRADIALYRAKADGRGRYVQYESSMDDKLRLSRQIERELRTALVEDQFELLYQPQVTSDGATTVGVEALIRWNHPEKGMLSPGHFMPVVERSDLMWQIGAWVIRTACRAGHAWPGLLISVNVSPAQIRHADFAELLRTILEEENFDPRRLELEVTETVVMDHTHAAMRVFRELREIGVRIALDDFGTGYSSLSYLRRFSFEKFKIDRSFITSVETEPEAAAIVHTLIGLGDALGMHVTAEGIETQGQHRFLQAAGCETLQGFLFSRPVREEIISARLRDEAETDSNVTPLERAESSVA
ncbi:bifunctional diguanylate cyclase/phosphodiesterase [Breoghania sp. L-A4]|uniref:putative bifunctional diguanylate cyclase/phosphodiesterase n=1 Tax=Breoghania sp. L-A4 TaxID=2304600 RepID=UPI000E359B91|nr:bifunctional diguanylate cyclase/phosphodiesterase [Breoghania sp. L-A4]AXS41124.1 bifunctional diguanylate cyclase/phosphodiesterase [Breoghania sp. L-A4]